MPNSAYDLIDHERLASLVGSPVGEEPVVSLYFGMGAGSQERRLVLKNLAKDGEEQARRDTGFDDERRKKAIDGVARVHAAAEEILRGTHHPRGTFVVFARNGGIETLRIPVVLRDRIVVERTPYTSPLSAVIEQYERYGVVMADRRRGRILEVYLGAIVEWEAVDEKARDSHEQARGGGHDGLEDARRRNIKEYELNRHLQHVSERAFGLWKRHGFSQLIVAGPPETLNRFVEHLHPYLRPKIVARESWPLDLPKHELLQRVIEVEKKLEEKKERELLSQVRDHLGGDLLATTGPKETLRELYYGRVATLIVDDGAPPLPGRECPECRFLLPRPEDAKESTPTLVECPLCKRPMRPVPDVADQAVELAIQSGSKVEHIAYAKEELAWVGGMASVLRFKS